MAGLLAAVIGYAALFGICWVIDQLPFVRSFWNWFIQMTDAKPFFRGTPPEMRLASIAFFVAFAGAILGFVGAGTYEKFPPMGLLSIAGFFTTAFGILLCIYAITAGQLVFFGLRRRNK